MLYNLAFKNDRRCVTICSDNERSIQFKVQLLSKGIATCIRRTLNVRAINFSECSEHSCLLRVTSCTIYVQHMSTRSRIHASACILGNVIRERPLIDRFRFNKLIL